MLPQRQLDIGFTVVVLVTAATITGLGTGMLYTGWKPNTAVAFLIGGYILTVITVLTLSNLSSRDE